MHLFCSVKRFNGKGVRRRNRFLVVDEIQRQAEEYGVKHFMWLDDDLFQPDSVNLFNEKITRRNLNITWDASNGVMASATTNSNNSGCLVNLVASDLVSALNQAIRIF